MDSVDRPAVFQISHKRRIRKSSSHGFSCSFRCHLMVNLPYSKQKTSFHLNLVERLNDDWGSSFAFLKCSTGDFAQALSEGRVFLGHVWAEVFALCLQQVLYDLYGLDNQISFDERYEVVDKNEIFVEYVVQFQFSAVIDGQLTDLARIVTEYLNAIMEDRDFDIKQRLEEFVSSHNHLGQAQTIRSTRSTRRKRRACYT